MIKLTKEASYLLSKGLEAIPNHSLLTNNDHKMKQKDNIKKLIAHKKKKRR